MPAKLKMCCRCNEEKPLAAFRRDRARVDGRQSACKACARSFQSERYQKVYAESRAARDKKLRDENRERLSDYKRNIGCRFCKENDPICLEFHHRDSSDKLFNIGTNTHRTWPHIEREITKCIVVCSNCHKKLHAGREGYAEV